MVILGQLVVDGPDDAIGANDDLTGYGNASPVASAAILGGCWSYGGANPPCDYNTVPANGGGSGVYADDFAPALPSPQPSKPTVNAATVYSEALPGLQRVRAPPVTQARRSASTRPGARHPTPASTEAPPGPRLLPRPQRVELPDSDRQPRPGRRTSPAGTDGTLYVSGKVFIDASLDDGQQRLHPPQHPAGGGSIYINGTLTLNGASLCAIYNTAASNPCDFDNWTPNTDPTTRWCSSARSTTAA